MPHIQMLSRFRADYELYLGENGVTKKVFRNLRMILRSSDEEFSLDINIASGHADFNVTIPLLENDYSVIENDEERAAFLQAAFHHPFQLKETWLNKAEQREYLDIILHSPKEVVESFLTEKDHGRAHGAISNAVRITCGRDQSNMRSGQWFQE